MRLVPDPAPQPGLPPDWQDPAVQWRLMIHTGYRGPFERIMDWLWCLDDTCPDGIRREVPDGSARNWLACRAEDLDRAWRLRYVRRRRYPRGRWRRSPPARHQKPPDPVAGTWP